MFEEKKHIRGYSVIELEKWLVKNSEQKYRAGQIFSWVQKGVVDFEQMTNISKKLRNSLFENFILDNVNIIENFISEDGTHKYLLELIDGEMVECVLLKYKYGYTICVSTQVGCRMGCTFCASTIDGRIRQLSSAEMVGQILAIQNREIEISAIQDEITSIRNKDKEVSYKNDSELSFQKLNQSSIVQRKVVADIENEINYLHNEIEDSAFFIDTLNKKIEALKNSIKTREFLGNLPLEYCPECLSKIKSIPDNSNCKLCKEPIDKSFGVVQARRMKLEIGFQINESKKLLEINNRSLLELKVKYSSEIGKLHDIQKQVNLALEDVKSYSEEIIDNLNNRKGFIEGEILQYRTMLENAELYDRLLQKKNDLEKEIKYLKTYIFKTEKAQITLKQAINTQIKEEGIYLLNNDLDRQDEFKNANDFFIDYANNIAFLSNKFSKYSASSNFYLKVAARFSIFLASLYIEEMRYPRFIFADNMEDKGIEMKRAQNLQELLIKRVNNFDANNYQMIYTTSYITEELNSSELVVGEYYTKENPSLKNINK